MRVSQKAMHLQLLIIAVTLLAFYEPSGLAYVFSWPVLLFRILQVFSVAVLLVVFCRQIRLDGIFIIIVLLCLAFSISTLLASGSITELYRRIIVIVAAWIFIRSAISLPKHKTLFLISTILFFILIVALLSTLLLYDQGGFRERGDYWLFGQKNTMRNIVFPALLFTQLYDCSRGLRWSKLSIATAIASVMLILLVQSVATMVLLLIYFIGWLAIARNLKFPSLKILVLMYALIEYAIVWMREISVFNSIVTTVLEKDITLSGRTAIWDDVFIQISKNDLLFGSGLQNLNDIGLFYDGYMVSHAHNALLDLMLKGGLVCVSLFIILFGACCRTLWKEAKKREAKCITLCLGCFLVASVFGEMWSFGFFIVLFYAAYFSVKENSQGCHEN